MRYLKLFEDLESSGYERCDNYPIKSDEYEMFTERELERFNRIGFVERSATSFRKTSLQGKVLQPSERTGLRIVQIWSIGDEWYYIRTRRPYERSFTWYKCDQIEGVINCLNKEDFTT